MNNDVNEAIIRLNKILPLKANQLSMSPELQQLHRDILISYITLGRSLNRTEIASRVSELDETIHTLQENDMVVFNSDGDPIGAYPFTMEERDHTLHIGKHTLHCMCALDSLAVSPMYDTEVQIDSVCHLSGKPLVITQNNLEILNKAAAKDIYFAINWNAASDNACCADSLCTEMIFIKGKSAANNWNDEDNINRQIFTLDEAVKFAAGFFMPLLE